MVKMTGAKALIESLKKQNVEALFGIPGGQIIPVYDALAKSNLRHILMRHEQCVAHAADGYARASGKVGVCLSTSGPGATNLVTGIASAYIDSSPIVAFTGQVTKKQLGKDSFQEADILGITTPITKSSFQVRHAEEIPKLVNTAFYIASTGRPGPVLIDFPCDTQIETSNMNFSDQAKIQGYRPNLRPHNLQIKKAVDLLIQAEHPFIIAGGGIISSGASQELLSLVDLLGAPIATTFMGKGCISEIHPLATGILGMHGTLASNILVQEADVLLAIGTRLSDRTTAKVEEFCPEAKLIHIDIDSAEIGKNLQPTIPIVADAKTTLIEMNKRLRKRFRARGSSPWIKKLNQLKNQLEETGNSGTGLKPAKLLNMLRKELPDNAIMCTEVGQNQMWSALYLKAYKPRTFISSGGLGTMGFGFPSAIGAKVACPKVPVVDIAGDGSFRMTEQELATCVSEEIPVTVIILNNSVLGMVAQWQRLFWNKQYSGVHLGNSPDFVKLAEAYGAQGIRVESIDSFSKAVKTSLKSDVTTVIDVPISPTEDVFPMVPGGKGLSEMIW